MSSSPSTTASAGWSVLTTSYTVTHTFCLTGEQCCGIRCRGRLGSARSSTLRSAPPLPDGRLPLLPCPANTARSLSQAPRGPNPGRRRAHLRPRRHRPSPTRHGSPPRSRYRGSSVTSPPATTQRAAPSRPRSAASQPRVLVPTALFAAAPTPSRSAAARSSRFRRWPIILVFNRSMAPSRARCSLFCLRDG